MTPSRRLLPLLRLSREFCDLRKPPISELLKNASNFKINEASDPWVSNAYHVEKAVQEKLEKEVAPVQEKIDPQNTSIVLFPGQGSQYPGMAKGLTNVPGVKEMFDYASSVMKLDLLKLCTEGPDQLLNMTINCQAAILVTSLAVLEKLKYTNPVAIEKCVATAGFSVGEYAALVFSGVMTFEEAVQLVKVRGEAMQACSEVRPSGLLSVFLTHDANLNYAMKLAREWCQQKHGIDVPVCAIANFLYPGGKVVGGDNHALSFLRRNGRDFGIRASKPLEVSGAFHTPLMEPAKHVLKKALSQIQLQTPAINVISNFSGTEYTTVKSIQERLVKQVYKPVQWEQTMHKLYHRDKGLNFPNTYEVGPGGTLRSMLRKVNAKAHLKSTKVEM